MGFITEFASEAGAIDEARKWLDVAVVLRHRQGSIIDFTKWSTIIHERTWEMAKRVKEANGKELKKADFKGFANVELTLEEKAEMREWIKNIENVQVELDEMLASLYKLSVVKSEAMGSYQATAYGQDAKGVNAGLILSAFAPHWWDALACLAYKHAIKCEGIWGTTADSEADMWG